MVRSKTRRSRRASFPGADLVPMTIITEELNYDRVKQQYINHFAMDLTKANVTDS